MIIVDAHLDLAASALGFGRNLLSPIPTIRKTEKRKDNIVSVTIPALQAGGVAIAFGTLFAMPRTVAEQFPLNMPALNYPDDAPQDFRQARAHEVAMRQIDYYQRMADENEHVTLLQSWSDVENVIASQETDAPQLGILIHMEGADPVREPEEIELWVEHGLRSIGFAWDDTRYTPGQWREAGNLPRDGYRLLERMGQYNLLCDLTHMSEKATFDVLEAYEGPVAATHCNARALVSGTRQLSDAQIRALADRDGVIGAVLFNRFLRQDHAQGDRKSLVTLDHVVAHIDHVCQLLGNADHVGIGSDMDGGFGAEDTPTGIDSSADLPKIATALKAFGYDAESIEKIMHGNWLRLMRRVLA